MDLVEEVKNRRLIGSDEVEVAAGKTLTIETSPDGEEILSEEVPAGKVWTLKISVAIVETDA